MKRLLVSACLAGLAISGVGVRAAEAGEPIEAGAPASAAKTSQAKGDQVKNSQTKSSHIKAASIKAGKPTKGKLPVPAAKPADAEAADADAALPELQADATPADTQATEAPAADASPDAAADKAAQKAKATPSYMRTGHPEIDALVATHARVNNVPEALVHRVIVRESKYQKDLVGSCGCIGLMQIKLATARGLGYTGDAKGLHDPSTNLMYGVKYLAGAYRAANGDHDRAVHYFAKGYYEAAKRLRVADAQPFARPERVHAPLDITPRMAGAIHTAKHAGRAPLDKQATASR